MKTVTGRSSGGRSSPQLVTENERPYPWRQIAGIAAGKTLMRGSFALVSICMNEILLDIYGGNLTAVARYGSAISSVNTLVSFFMQPLSGALMDKYGRKPFLVCGGILAGILRGQVGLNPSSLSYTLYRLFLPVFYAPFFPAFRATMSDLLDRRSDRYAQAMETIEWFGSVMHLLCLYLMRNTLTPSQGAILAGALGISGGLLINFTVEETLREEDRREVEYESLGNPISAISFFKKNEQMTKLGLLHVIVTVPYYNTTLGMYRRQRFGWTMSQMTSQQMYSMLFSLGSPFLLLKILRTLGNKGTMILEERISVIQNIFNICNSNESYSWVTTFLAALQFGDTGFNRELAIWSKGCRCGEGELEGAMANINLPLQLLLPVFFTEMHIYFVEKFNIVYAPLVLTTVLHVTNGEFFIPCLWPENRN
jgi:MFS family permease